MKRQLLAGIVVAAIVLGSRCMASGTPQSPLPDSIRSHFIFPAPASPAVASPQIPQWDPQNQPAPTVTVMSIPSMPTTLQGVSISGNFPAPNVGTHFFQSPQANSFVGLVPVLPVMGTSFSTSTNIVPEVGQGSNPQVGGAA